MRSFGAKKILALVAALSCAAAVNAQQSPAELEFVPRNAAVVASVRVQELLTNPALKPIRDIASKNEDVDRGARSFFGSPLSAIERITVIVPELELFGPAEPTLLFLVTTTKPYDRKKVTVEVRADLGRGAKGEDSKKIDEKKFPDEKRFEEKKSSVRDSGAAGLIPALFQPEQEPPFDPKRTTYSTRDGNVITFLTDRTLLVIPNTQRIDDLSLGSLVGLLLRRSTKAPLSDALAEAKSSPLVVGVNFGAIKINPVRGADDAIRPLAKASDALVTMKIDEMAQLNLRLRFGNEADAKDGEKILRTLTENGIKFLAAAKTRLDQDERDPILPVVLAIVVDLLKQTKIELQENAIMVASQVKAEGIAKPFTGVLIEKINAARDRTVSVNNLKQIALAAHAYHDTYRQFPFFRAKKIHPGLSWRVAILPYIEQQALYNQFKLNEPWDSEHNIKLAKILPAVYAPVGKIKAKEGHTFYQSFAGPNTISEATSIVMIPDGTSNTIMVAEAGESVLWTKPDDLKYDAKNPLPKMGGLFPGGMNAALADGSVMWINLQRVAEQSLRDAIVINDGNPLPLDWNNPR